MRDFKRFEVLGAPANIKIIKIKKLMSSYSAKIRLSN